MYAPFSSLSMPWNEDVKSILYKLLARCNVIVIISLPYIVNVGMFSSTLRSVLWWDVPCASYDDIEPFKLEAQHLNI